MLKKLFIFFLLALFVTFGKSYAQNLSHNDVANHFSKVFSDKKVPATAEFFDKDGNAVKLSKFKGKVIILNFWKATCRPCLIELPGLNTLAQKHNDLVVIAVSQGDESADFIDRILHKERRLNLIDVALDKNQALLKLMGGGKVPQTYLIDKDGTIRGHIQGGADFNAPRINAQIKELL